MKRRVTGAGIAAAQRPPGKSQNAAPNEAPAATLQGISFGDSDPGDHNVRHERMTRGSSTSKERTFRECDEDDESPESKLLDVPLVLAPKLVVARLMLPSLAALLVLLLPPPTLESRNSVVVELP